MQNAPGVPDFSLLNCGRFLPKVHPGNLGFGAHCFGNSDLFLQAASLPGERRSYPIECLPQAPGSIVTGDLQERWAWALSDPASLSNTNDL
ncbi:hypothetical protein [Roseiflexus castenholzii]|uniref:hypothetical protein n=1 Tax=Roseiflexus castenholzii TaxID=120962 RepID=UPI0002D79D4B|nr:hypothetical protein [Roseiflexus castenholzii]